MNVQPPSLRYSVALTNATSLGPLLQDQRVIFHGINKSGSLAMSNVIREAYFYSGRASQFISHYHKTPLEISDMYNIISHTRIGHCFFVGHYLYDTVNLAGDEKVYVTQLRHPLPRVVSCYQWIKNKAVKKNGGVDDFQSLEHFVKDGSQGGRSWSQVAQFAPGGVRGDAWRKMSTQALLDGAIEVISNRVRWFGIAEYFEESIFALAHLCGLPSVTSWKRDNRNADRRLVSELPASTVSLIEDVFRHDIEFYTWAKRLFLDRIAGVDFGPDLASYQRACVNEYKDRLL